MASTTAAKIAVIITAVMAMDSNENEECKDNKKGVETQTKEKEKQWREPWHNLTCHTSNTATNIMQDTRYLISMFAMIT